MTVRDAFKNQDAIMAQHRAIGVPSEAELQASPNVVYVHAYVKDDGTLRNPLKVWNYNKFARLNNRAKEQQDAGQLENFLFNIPITFSKEEIEELKRKYNIK